jgi:hypothetical protein
LKLREREFEQKVRLDEFRAHMERDTIELNRKFASDLERFHEVNHMVLSGQSESKKSKDSNPQQSAFLQAHGIADGTTVRPRSIFVLTPFHTSFDEFFSGVISVGQETNYSVSRGDEHVQKSDIFSQVLTGIVTSRFIVANITGRNPNVFYELGVAHALDKEVILVAENDAEVPFDLQSKRIIFYGNIDELKSRLATALVRLVDA